MRKLAAMTMALLLTLSLAGAALAQDYNYVTADQVAEMIKSADPGWALIDIQPQTNYDKNHLKSVIATFAFPVDTPELQAKLLEGVAQVGDGQNIVIVCPGGRTGANNSVNYLLGQGFAADRLYILKDGQNGWPRAHSDLLAD